MELLRTPDSSLGARQLCDVLREGLQAGKRVLWLIPGGSNIPISVQIMDGIDESLSRQLTLALTDERFGPYNHPDSNWRQLDEAGFDSKAARCVAVLTADNLSLDDSVQRYNQQLEQLFAEYDLIVGQFGMGADGHIAGILPHSAAVNAPSLVAGYDAGAFIRITLTFNAILHCQAAWLFAFGDGKRTALEGLKVTRPLEDQPAQILKQLPEAYIYNDQTGKDAV